MENKANILLNFQASTNEAAEKIKQASEQAGKDLENGIKNGAKRGADQASKSIKKISVFDDLKNVFKGIKDGKIDVVASVAGAAGGGAGGGLNNIVGMLGSLGTSLGGIGVAIGAGVSLLHNYLTSGERAGKTKFESASVDEQLASSQISRQLDAQTVDKKLMDQLELLGKQTGLTAAEMQRAMKIIAEFQRRYGSKFIQNSGLRLDFNANKLEGVDNARGLMLDKQSANLDQAYNKKLQALGDKIRGFIQSNVADQNDSFAIKRYRRSQNFLHDRSALYRDPDAVFRERYKNYTPEQRRSLTPQFLENQRAQIFAEDEKMFSALKKEKNASAAYNTVKKMYEATDQSNVKRRKALFEIMEMLQQQLAIEKKINEARNAGIKQLQLQKAAMAEAEKRRVLTEEQQKQDNIMKNVRESDLSFRYAQLDNDSDREQFIWDNQILPRMGKVGNLEAENENLRGKTYASDKQRSADAQRLAQIEAQLKQAGLDQKTKEKLEAERTGLKTKVYGDQAERAKDTMTIAKNETEILRLKGEIQKFEQQRQQLIERMGKEYDRETQSMQDELDVERLILQGRYEEARILKHINQLKNKGMGYDQQQQQALEQQRKQMDAMKFKKYLRGEAYNALDSMTPKTLQNDFQKKVREWQWTNQTKMSQQQQNDLYSVMQHQYSQMTLNRMKTDLQNDISRSEIKTNDLTARGGFVGGAVEAPLTKINSNITNFQTMVNSNMTQLRTLMQRLGII